MLNLEKLINKIENTPPQKLIQDFYDAVNEAGFQYSGEYGEITYTGLFSSQEPFDIEQSELLLKKSEEGYQKTNDMNTWTSLTYQENNFYERNNDVILIAA